MKVVVVAVACLLLGCGIPCMGVPCGSCPPSVTVRISDATTGGPVPDVTINGFSCEQQEAATVCSNLQSGAGTYELLIQAPSYVDERRTVLVPNDEPSPWTCCGCPYLAQTLSLTMENVCAGVTCPACGPTVVLLVVDFVTKEPVPDVWIGPDWTCSWTVMATRCEFYGPPGPYLVTVTAPGYRDTQVQNVLEAPPLSPCCDCYPEPEFPFFIYLDPL